MKGTHGKLSLPDVTAPGMERKKQVTYRVSDADK
jgi:hypothetical protein